MVTLPATPWPISRGSVGALWVCLALSCAPDLSAADSPVGTVQPEPAPEKSGPGVDWVRAGLNTNVAVWGIRGGLLWGLPAPLRPRDGPRGLIRLWYPVLPNGAYDLVNFIAVEPVVGGRRGFSELERSELDGVPGKRLWTTSPDDPNRQTVDLSLWPGQLASPASGPQALAVRVSVERFENGAHVALVLTQRSDAPEELGLTIHAEPESAPVECCILTATMGNKARTRLLWLKDTVVRSRELYPDYDEPGFAPHRVFGLERLRRTPAGAVVVALTTDEKDPSAVEPFPAPRHWRYDGFPVTQYWKKPAGTWSDDLEVAVNGRYTYWLSRHPIPGGVAFENFELRQRFHQGQHFIFGITRKPPKEVD